MKNNITYTHTLPLSPSFFLSLLPLLPHLIPAFCHVADSLFFDVDMISQHG